MTGRCWAWLSIPSGPATSTGRVARDKIITGGIDAHAEAEHRRRDDDDGTAGVLVPVG